MKSNPQHNQKILHFLFLVAFYPYPKMIYTGAYKGRFIFFKKGGKDTDNYQPPLQSGK